MIYNCINYWRLVLLTAMMLVSSALLAEERNGKLDDNIYYSWDTKTGEVVIYGQGDMNCYYGDGPFVNSKNINYVLIKEGVTSIGDFLFDGCTNLNRVDLPSGITFIGGAAFQNCCLGKINIPSSVRRIHDNAFSGNSFSTLTIPEGVKEIGIAAFSDCYYLTSVSLPSSLETIEGFAFINCYELEEITIPSGIKSIEEWTFGDCHCLSKIYLPSSIEAIGEYAFQNCYMFSLYARHAPIEIDSTVFKNIINKDCTLYVLKKHIDDFKKAEIWKDFMNISEIPSDVHDIDGDGLVNVADVTELIDYILKHPELQ